jgi:hypothetical protein
VMPGSQAPTVNSPAANSDADNTKRSFGVIPLFTAHSRPDLSGI